MNTMQKRKLHETEITDIIQNVLKNYYITRNILPSMRTKFEQEFTKRMQQELETLQIYPDGLDLLKTKILQKYQPVPPAKSVGIICGQSIGEMQTQMTLNTFHSAGIANRTVVQGVPRFLEIIDTNRSETQGTPTATIYFCPPVPRTISEARERVQHTLVNFTFEQLFERHWIYPSTQPLEHWYAMHSAFERRRNRVCYVLKLDILFRYKITLEQIYQALCKQHNDILCIYSPLYEGRLDVWSDLEDSKIEETLHPSLLGTKVCGIDKIQNIFFMKQGDEWYIETDGSNLEEIMNLDYVDSYRTVSNDIWEIYNLFGIEAVRSYIVEELTNLMPTIHNSHIHLLTDRMTVSGRLKSISRYTRKHENSSVLSKATFEETLSGFLRSALMNEKDTINGSSASIICGKVPRVGTGLNDLLFDDSSV
jgi:DNA-directed RNA polymerase beta' subunit